MAETPEWVAMPNAPPMATAGHFHDMLVGPCACGAWHSPGDFPEIETTPGPKEAKGSSDE